MQAVKNAKKASERATELETLLESQRQESSRTLRRMEKKMNDLSTALEEERKSSAEYHQSAEQVRVLCLAECREEITCRRFSVRNSCDRQSTNARRRSVARTRRCESCNERWTTSRK